MLDTDIVAASPRFEGFEDAHCGIPVYEWNVINGWMENSISWERIVFWH